MCDCALCKREVSETTFHHLIPVMLHSKTWYKKNYEVNYLKSNGIQLCDLCHHAVHKLY